MNEGQDYTKVTRCQVCSSERLIDFLDLGMNPSCNLISEDDLNKGKEGLWPLRACVCEDCWCVQTRFIVSPHVLFGEDYHHIAGIPLAFRRNANELAVSLVSRFGLGPKDLVVDLGSNDGTLLEQYKPFGIKVLGVDPSGVAKMAIERGIPTVNEFFDEECAKRIVSGHGKVTVVTALNTFAHVAALHSFVRGVRLLLADHGVFVIETHYLLDMVEKLQYDFIYHEHLREYSVSTLARLFRLHDMEVFDVQRIPAHAGSIRVFACRKGEREVSENVNRLIELEARSNLFRAETYEEFASRASRQRNELMELLSGIKKSGKRLVGLTYPCRGATLMQYCGMTSETLEYISDNTPAKIGKYTPGSHIRIADEKALFEDNPDYGLLLSWHLTDEIIPKFRARGFRGSFVIPLPKPTIVWPGRQ